MSWKELAAGYLHFSRRERTGVIALLLVIACIFFLPDIIGLRKAAVKSPITDSTWVNAMAKLETDNQPNDNYSNNPMYLEKKNGYRQSQQTKSLFYFDPNTISAAEWKQLGVRDKTITTIQKYLSHGGKFKKPEDLSRIYGLFPDEFERIAPFIRIPEPSLYKEFTIKDSPNDHSPKTYLRRHTVIDINTADTTAWIALPGIGNKLAARIVNFRDKLGGFYSIDQVAETYGLADSVFQPIKQYLKLENKSVKKININTATVDQLKTHPYIRYALANSIITYRNEHGIFPSVNDLRKIMAVTDNILNKVSPYLTVEK